MTFDEYKAKVADIMMGKYGIQLDTIDTSPLYGWFLDMWEPSEAANALAIKDGFPE